MVSVLLLILCSLLWKWRPLLLRRRASLHRLPPLHLDNLTASVVARTRLTPYLLSLIESELRSVYDFAIYEQIACQVVHVILVQANNNPYDMGLRDRTDTSLR